MVKKYESLVKNRDKKSFDSIGGFYIDDEGYLCVGVVKGKNRPSNFKNEQYVKYIEVENSLETLNSIKKQI